MLALLLLTCRLLVAFNTSSGLPVTFVPLRDAAGRAKTGMSDANTNIAEAGTISMEFTSIGRLLGKCAGQWAVAPMIGGLCCLQLQQVLEPNSLCDSKHT